MILKKALIAIIRFYQLGISPLIPPRCRFYPTCSQYAIEALQIHGVCKGSWLSCKRVCRCHPWGGHGIDLVPQKPINWQALNYSYITKTQAKKLLQQKSHSIIHKRYHH